MAALRHLPVLLKDRFHDSRFARRTYATLLGRSAFVFGMRGDLLNEIQFRMRAVRALISEGLGEDKKREVRGAILQRLFGGMELGTIASNRLLQEYARSEEARRHRAFWAQYPLDARVRMRFPRAQDDPERRGDLLVLKPWNPQTGERGVLLVSFTERIREFAAVFDIARLASRYQIVLQPSSWGYQDTTFLFYLGRDADVLVQCPWAADYQFITALDSNLVATTLGAGDWVDPEVFRPAPGVERSYDLVMVSSWQPLKRHRDLFRALAELRRAGRTFRVALVGFPAGWTRRHIERLAQRHGVADCCDIVESIPQDEVARVVSRSRGYVLLSRREGANRALYEALFCNTPVLVYAGHHGVNVAHVNEATGLTFESSTLARAMAELVDTADAFTPRAWALANTGYANATARMNEELRVMARRRGEPWTQDIVATKMAPNLRYAEPGRYRDFSTEHDDLAVFLRER